MGPKTATQKSDSKAVDELWRAVQRAGGASAVADLIGSNTGYVSDVSWGVRPLTRDLAAQLRVLLDLSPETWLELLAVGQQANAAAPGSPAVTAPPLPPAQGCPMFHVTWRTGLSPSQTQQLVSRSIAEVAADEVTAVAALAALAGLDCDLADEHGIFVGRVLSTGVIDLRGRP